MPGFYDQPPVSRLGFWAFSERNNRWSPMDIRKIPVFGRLRLETGFDLISPQLLSLGPCALDQNARDRPKRIEFRGQIADTQ